MRQDCKFFESRTYANGDTVRKCDLNLAPEAPWRCPADCARYTRRMADVNWAHGSLVTPETPPEPESLGDDGSIAALLGAASDIINEAAPGTLADLAKERKKREKRGWVRRVRPRKATSSRRTPKRSPKNTGESLGEKLRRRYRNGR